MNSYYHAKAAARRWGGDPEHYIEIIEFMDETKKAFPDIRHRALLHNSYGVWLVEKVFGRVIEVPKAEGGTKQIPVREIAEQHILEDLGFIPEVGDWLRGIDIKVWMGGKQKQVVSRGHFLDETVKEGKK